MGVSSILSPRAVEPGAFVCGSEVVAVPDDSPTCVLRCLHCGHAYGAPAYKVRGRAGCGCPKRCRRYHGGGRSRAARPQSRTAARLANLMRAGMEPADAARACGVRQARAEGVWLRWVVLPERDALRQRVAELEAALKGGG